MMHLIRIVIECDYDTADIYPKDTLTKKVCEMENENIKNGEYSITEFISFCENIKVRIEPREKS